MSNIVSRQTRVSLALVDPREYGLAVAEDGVAKLLFDANARGTQSRAPYHLADQVGRRAAICQSLATRNDAPLYRALSAAQDDDAYSATIAEIVEASCCRVVGDKVHVAFAVPITLHCATWPVRATRAAEDWLDFDSIADAIGLPSMTAGIDDITVLPQLFTVDSLTELPWSTWYSLTAKMPGSSTELLTGLPAPRPFEMPTDDNRAQGRVIVGAFSCSARAAERFQRNSVQNKAENAHVLTTLLQGQLGKSHGLMVVAGTPSVAPAAISEAQHMLNCARLRCFLDVIGGSLDELISLEAEAVKRSDGEGSLRFKARTRSCEWVLQKAEPWYGQKRHWKLLFSDVAAPYLKVQLGLTEFHFDSREMFADLGDVFG